MATSSERAPNDGTDGSGDTTPLMVPLDYVPRKGADVLELDMGDGIILYNRDADLVHHLNPTAGLMWHLFEGEASIATLATEVSEECGIELGRARSQLQSLAAELDALGLVHDVSRGMT
jgi:Coenzyme PQQ synthesis protein D (PqqD)